MYVSYLLVAVSITIKVLAGNLVYFSNLSEVADLIDGFGTELALCGNRWRRV